MLAEWEHQSMVQLTWPHEGTDWAPILDEITAVYEEMARAIRKREPLLIVDNILQPKGRSVACIPHRSWIHYGRRNFL